MMRRLLNLLGIGRTSIPCAEPECEETAGEPLEQGDPAYCAAHLLHSPSLQRRLSQGPGSKFRQDLDRQLRELAVQDAATYTGTEATAEPDESGADDRWSMDEIIGDTIRDDNPGPTEENQ